MSEKNLMYEKKYFKYKKKYLNMQKKFNMIGAYGIDDVPTNLHNILNDAGNPNNKVFNQIFSVYENIPSATQQARLQKEIKKTSVVDVIYSIASDEVRANEIKMNLRSDPFSDIVGPTYRSKFVEILHGLLHSYKILKDEFDSNDNDNILLKFMNVQGDGNCFFHSINLFLQLSKCNPTFNNDCEISQTECFDKLINSTIANATQRIERLYNSSTQIEAQLNQLFAPLRNIQHCIKPLCDMYNLNILIFELNFPFDYDNYVENSHLIQYYRNTIQNENTGNVILLNMNHSHYELIYLNIKDREISIKEKLLYQKIFFDNVVKSYSQLHNFGVNDIPFHILNEEDIYRNIQV